MAQEETIKIIIEANAEQFKQTAAIINSELGKLGNNFQILQKDINSTAGSMDRFDKSGKKFNKGGSMKHEDIAKDKPMMKKVADTAVKGHEKRMHKMAGGGKIGQLSKADGCAVKGKSKGKMVTMKSGGYC